MALNAENGRFILHGRPTFLRFGEMHYFRISPELWSSSLQLLKEAGLNGISTYVPWVWHEPEEGTFDFEGRTHPARNLHGFLRACCDAGMSVMVRPGPFIYAEYNGLGHPLWLGRRYPETVAVGPDGHPCAGEFWFNYSLGHPVYRSKVANWYRKVLSALEVFRNSPVVALQIDNETGIMYGRSPGNLDWNPDTVQRYRDFLRQRYAGIEGLNRTWGANHAGWESVFPPVPPFKQALLDDWQVFFEDWIVDYLKWLADLARDASGVPLFLNEQSTFVSPANPRKKSCLTDFYGYDCYLKSSGTRYAADFPFLEAVSADVFSAYARPTSPLFAAEMGVGWFDPRSRVPERTVVQNVMGGIAHGLNGMCLYTVHDCEEENGQRYNYHSLLDIKGRPDSKYEAIKAVHRFIHDHEERLTRSASVRDGVATVVYHPGDRMVPDDFLPGHRLPDPARFIGLQGLHGPHALLMLSGFNPAMVDLENAEETDLQRYKVLFFPSNGYIDEQSFRKLLSYVQNGGTLVTLPIHPTHRLDGRPLDTKPLYPDVNTGLSVRGRWRLLGRVLLRWGAWYHLVTRRRLAKDHLYSMHLIDLFEPARALISARLKGMPLRRPDGSPIRGDIQVSGFAPRGDAQVLLHRGASREVVAHAAPVGEGQSVVLGTVLGGALMLPQYYRMRRGDIEALCDLLREWMSRFGVSPTTTCRPGLEVSYRTTGEYTFVFLINRGPRRKGNASLRRDLCSGPSDVLFTYGRSSVKQKGPAEFDYDLGEDGVVVLGFQAARRMDAAAR